MHAIFSVDWNYISTVFLLLTSNANMWMQNNRHVNEQAKVNLRNKLELLIKQTL